MKLIGDASAEKLRGGFYTPEPIARFILRWAVNGNKKYDILEPSCGDGVFLEQIKESNFEYQSATGIELVKEEAEKSRNIKLPRTKIVNQDFFSYCNETNQRFDLIIGNPPYIRYQYFDKDQRTEAMKIFNKADLKYSKLANAWVGFVVGATLLLKEKGKIAFVLPAEILQVGYAKQLRTYLAHQYNKINIVSFRKLVFPSAQQEVVLLLCEKNGSDEHMIEHLELEDASELATLDVANLKSPKKRIDFKANKWTFYFLNQKEIDFIENLLNKKRMKAIRNYAKVEVGMTTGSNQFFTVNKETIDEYQLKTYAKPMVGRSVQVSSLIFTKVDWQDNVRDAARAFFLLFPPRKEMTAKAIEYLKVGEKDGWHKLYKCSIRDEWQTVPSAWISEALFIRRNNIYPRLIINEAKAYTTDTMHRVTINKDATLTTGKPVDMRAFVGSYYNSLSLAFAEISGRSHGGGVLELMPNEVENILLPYHEKNADLIDKIDKMLRDKKSIDQILSVTDAIILKQRAGFSDEEIAMANRIWKKLLKRRMGRNGR
jgi:adenine-specific DNA-methyltransferase